VQHTLKPGCPVAVTHKSCSRVTVTHKNDWEISHEITLFSVRAWVSTCRCDLHDCELLADSHPTLIHRWHANGIEKPLFERLEFRASKVACACGCPTRPLSGRHGMGPRQLVRAQLAARARKVHAHVTPRTVTYRCRQSAEGDIFSCFWNTSDGTAAQHQPLSSNVCLRYVQKIHQL
jgi:hypothetical protein